MVGQVPEGYEGVDVLLALNLARDHILSCHHSRDSPSVFIKGNIVLQHIIREKPVEVSILTSNKLVLLQCILQDRRSSQPLQLDAQQIKEYLEAESCSQLVDIDERLSVDAKVMQYMITRAALLLRAYPTTLEQDQDTLKESKDEIDRMTCQLRLCEKRILVNCVAYCETILQSIQNKQ